MAECGRCHGTGQVYVEGFNERCPECGGTGEDEEQTYRDRVDAQLAAQQAEINELKKQISALQGKVNSVERFLNG